MVVELVSTELTELEVLSFFDRSRLGVSVARSDTTSEISVSLCSAVRRLLLRREELCLEEVGVVDLDSAVSSSTEASSALLPASSRLPS